MVKKLGFGLMRLPLTVPGDLKAIDVETTKKMVDYFIENGFTYFDTSYVYHSGMSEKTVKVALVDRYPRDSYTLASKCPTFLVKNEEDYETFFNEQLERTGAGYFDYYLLHTLDSWSYDIAVRTKGFEFLKRMKEDGKIKHIGISFHDQPETLETILNEHPEVEYVQMIVNYADFENQGVGFRKTYDIAVKYNKKIIVMEPIKGGFLANVPDEVEKMFNDYNPDASSASWAVRYAATLDNVFMVLSGMSTYEQMVDNTSYMKGFKPLNDEELKIIDKAVKIICKDKAIIKCTYCGKCRKDNDIPMLFGLYNNSKGLAGAMWQNNVYNALSAKYGKAIDYKDIDELEKICPEGIRIKEELQKVIHEFESN